MRLEARDLTVRYRGAPVPALDGVAAEVAPGQLTAVVGPNGGGKTTLFRALLGLVPLERGEVRLGDRPLGDWPRGGIASLVGALPQREEPMPMLTAVAAVLLGRYPRLGALSPVTGRDRRAVADALQRCDAWHLRDRLVDTLSGGEWQRVRLARALAQEPALLVLDEPTSSLDVRHEMELFELIRGLVADGLGALVITHHLNLAARYADRMLLLHQGRVALEGAPAEVLRSDHLLRVFDWPLAVTTWGDGVPQVVPLRPGEPGFVARSSPIIAPDDGTT